jgi:23S rRNA pseudouridine1911/1915/1917 synthase
LRPNPHTRGSRAPRRAGVTPLDILYEDRVLLVINKPAGLLSVPLPKKSAEPSVYDQLERYLRPQRRRPFVVHRIDRDTSGLVVFAKDPRSEGRLKEQFKRHTAERVYQAVVYGHPEPESGTWSDRLAWDNEVLIQKATHPRDPRGKDAICHYRVLRRFQDTSLIEVRLVTGKRNQIRLQARLRGHTLVGEERYIFGPAELRPIVFPRQALHAWKLAFTHPVDNRPLEFESPLPDDMKTLLRKLGSAK